MDEESSKPERVFRGAGGVRSGQAACVYFPWHSCSAESMPLFLPHPPFEMSFILLPNSYSFLKIQFKGYLLGKQPRLFYAVLHATTDCLLQVHCPPSLRPAFPVAGQEMGQWEKPGRLSPPSASVAMAPLAGAALGGPVVVPAWPLSSETPPLSSVCRPLAIF